MTVRLRDRADLLEPDTTTDVRNPDPRADWTKDPKRSLCGVPFYATPTGGGPDSVPEPFTASWTGYLPPNHGRVDLACTLSPAWRVRWDGDVYAIAGPVQIHKTRRRPRFLSVQLTRVEASR